MRKKGRIIRETKNNEQIKKRKKPKEETAPKWKIYLGVICFLSSISTGMYFIEEVKWISSKPLSFLTGLMFPLLVITLYTYFDKKFRSKIDWKKIAISMTPYLLMTLIVITSNVTSLYNFNSQGFPSTRLKRDPYIIRTVTFSYLTFSLDTRNMTITDIFFLATNLSLIIYLLSYLKKEYLTKFRQYLKTKKGKIFLIILLLCILIRFAGITETGWVHDESGWFLTGKALLMDNTKRFELWKPPIPMYFIALPSIIQGLVVREDMQNYHPIILSKLFSIIFSIFSGILLYLALKKTTNESLALQGFAMYSVFPFLVEYSRMAMTEIYLVFATIGTIYFLIRGIKEKEYLLLAIIFAVLAFAIKGTGLYILIPTVALAIYLYTRSRIIKWLMIIAPITFLIPSIVIRPETRQLPVYMNYSPLILRLFFSNLTFIWIILLIILFTYQIIKKENIITHILSIGALGLIVWTSTFLPLIKQIRDNMLNYLGFAAKDFILGKKDSIFKIFKTLIPQEKIILYMIPFLVTIIITVIFTPIITQWKDKNKKNKKPENKKIIAILAILTGMIAIILSSDIIGLETELLNQILILALITSASLFLIKNKNPISVTYYLLIFFLSSLAVNYRVQTNYTLPAYPLIIMLTYLLIRRNRVISMNNKKSIILTSIITIPLIILLIMGYPNHLYDGAIWVPDKELGAFIQQYQQEHKKDLGYASLCYDGLHTRTVANIKEIYGDTNFYLLECRYTTEFYGDPEKKKLEPKMLGWLKTAQYAVIFERNKYDKNSPIVKEILKHKKIKTINSSDGKPYYTVYDMELTAE